MNKYLISAVGAAMILLTSCRAPLPPLEAGKLMAITATGDLQHAVDSLNRRIHDLQQQQVLTGYDYVLTLRNLGKVYELKGKHELASHFYRRSLDVISHSVSISEDIELLVLSEYFELPGSTRGLDEMKRFAALASRQRPYPRPLLDLVLLELSDRYRQAGHYQSARYYLGWLTALTNSAGSAVPEHDLPSLLYDLAVLSYLEGDYGGARPVLEAVISNGSSGKDLLIKAHILAAKNARKEKAVLRSMEHYRKAEALAGSDPVIRDLVSYGLAEGYFLLREYGNAEVQALTAVNLSIELYGSSSAATAGRLDLLMKIYDFSGQYDKLNRLQEKLNKL